jgi:plasmid stabilization system protein ParE
MIRYRALGERIDAIVATGLFCLAFNIGWLLLFRLSPNASNLFISVVTAELVLFGAASARASWRALHAKLDAIIAALPGAPDALCRAEERDEAEIEAMRTGA